MNPIMPALCRVATRLTRQLFQCPHRHSGSVSRRATFRKTLQIPVRNFRLSSPKDSATAGHAFAPDPQPTSPLSSLSGLLKARRTPAKGAFFPKTSHKSVAYWLLGSAAGVFGIVVFGGLTRLTESGFASTKPSLHPLTDEMQIKHHRMATSNWQPTTFQR